MLILTLKKEGYMIDLLANRWLNSGVEKGDVLLVHSNIKRTLIEFRRKGFPITAQTVLDSFLHAIGQEGTLLLPLFNFDFTMGVPFDIRSTPSKMGVLTEAGRNHSASYRTGHPIYSFAAIGYRAKDFQHIDNISAYADDSPFGLLRKVGGKIASLDLPDQHSMTFYHHVEEIKQVDYRFYKTFTGTYIDRDGNSSIKSYKIYVRDIDRGVKTDVNPAGELMWKAGVYRGCRPLVDSGLRVAKAQDIFEFVSDIIDSGNAQGTLYSIGE
ncbi:AAC(3) family N-acetyltransferase [Escherichia coli]|nr:AAC(3) family N-acetyltransferase [Escherichia coli]